jgi:hypothetical protein
MSNASLACLHICLHRWPCSVLLASLAIPWCYEHAAAWRVRIIMQISQQASKQAKQSKGKQASKHASTGEIKR